MLSELQVLILPELQVYYPNFKYLYNVPYRVDKFKSSFPEIRQVKVPIPSEMDR